MHSLWTITPACIQKVRNICYNSARKEVKLIREELDVPKGKPLYLRDVAAYYDMAPKELAEMLYFSAKKTA